MAEKVCFVTTGATAPFTGLIESVLKPSSVEALKEAGYTRLLIQYGAARDVYDEQANAAGKRMQSETHKEDLIIDGIDFDPDGLQEQFQLVQQSKGLVISHAGSGTILTALRYQVPLIVVPNTALLDNHQEELAVAMERLNYLIRGDVKHLAPAIEKSEDFRNKLAQFPPITSGKHRETKSFAAIMDETMERDDAHGIVRTNSPNQGHAVALSWDCSWYNGIDHVRPRWIDCELRLQKRLDEAKARENAIVEEMDLASFAGH